MRAQRTLSATLALLIALGFSLPATSQAAQPSPPPGETEAPQPMPEAVPLPPATADPAGQAPATGQPAEEPQPLNEPVAPLARAPLLSPYERDMLERGPISTGSHIGGGVLGTWIGFGIGHAVQGRYDEGGLIFTLGEAAGLAMLVTGLVNSLGDSRCFSNAEAVPGTGGGQSGCQSQSNENLWTGLAVSGGVLFTVIRIWEVVDVWTGPMGHNAAYRRIRRKAQGGGEGGGWSLSFKPVLLPNGGGMAVAGGRF